MSKVTKTENKANRTNNTKKITFGDLSFSLKAVIVWGFITLGLYVLGLAAVLFGGL